jgi:hypothetical protein
MYQPIPRHVLIQRGSCCGNHCKNCPYFPKYSRGAKLLASAFDFEFAVYPIRVYRNYTLLGKLFRKELAVRRSWAKETSISYNRDFYMSRDGSEYQIN